MSVNPQHLYQTLQAAAAAEHAVRVPAFEELTRLKTQAGYLSSLIQLATSEELAPQLRQLCAVEFKNSAVLRWEPGSDAVVPIDETEKAHLRELLVPICISGQLEGVRSQMLVVLQEALQRDFPHNWPGVAEHVVGLLVHGQVGGHALVGALDCLNLIFKPFEYFDPSEKERAPLQELVAVSFPTLLQLLTAANSDASEDAALVRKNIAKIFYKACMYDEPPSLRDKAADRIAPWIDAFIALLQAPLPDAVRSGVDPARSPGWAARKNAVHLLSLLLERFSDPERDFKNKARRMFGARFALRFHDAIVGAFLQQLTLLTSGVEVPDRFVGLLLQSLLNGCVPYNVAYNTLRPHILPFVTGLVFPLAQPAAAHVARFTDDPRDFLRHEFEINHAPEEIFGSWGAALHFFTRLFLARPETMQPVMQFLVGECERFRRGEAAVSIKCAALHIVGGCNKVLTARDSSVRELVPQFLSEHVFPDLDAADGLLRARACWTLQQFSAQIADLGAEAAGATVQKVLERMHDPLMPVRVMAACALGSFVDNPDIHSQLEPLVGDLLDAFLGLMNEVESDILIHSLQELVNHFEDAIVPHATSLVVAVLAKFHEYADAVQGDGDGDDGEGGFGGGGEADFGDADEENNVAMAAQQCLSAVRQVLMACEKVQSEEFWANMVVTLLAGLEKYIGINTNDTFLEDMSQTLSLLIYVPEKLPANSWAIFDPLMIAYESGGDSSRLSALLNPLDNLIDRATDGLFVENRLERLYRAVKSVLDDHETDEVIVADAVRIYESLILCCGGSSILSTRLEQRESGLIDGLMPSLIRDLLARLQTTEKRVLKCTLLDTLCECFIYDAPLTLATLDAAGATEPLLRGLLELELDFFKRLHDKKMVAMGLTALLFSWPLAQLPPVVRELAVPILSFTLRIIDALQEQAVSFKQNEIDEQELAAKLAAEHPHLTPNEVAELVHEAMLAKQLEGVPEGQFDEDDDDDDGADDDDDDGDEPDFGNEHGGLHANMDNIERLAAKAAAARDGDFSDIDDDFFGDMGVEAEMDYTCPLDGVEEFALFMTRFDEAAALEPQLLMDLVNALSPEDRELIDDVRMQFDAWREDLQANADQEE